MIKHTHQIDSELLCSGIDRDCNIRKFLGAIFLDLQFIEIASNVPSVDQVFRFKLSPLLFDKTLNDSWVDSRKVSEFHCLRKNPLGENGGIASRAERLNGPISHGVNRLMGRLYRI